MVVIQKRSVSRQLHYLWITILERKAREGRGREEKRKENSSSLYRREWKGDGIHPFNFNFGESGTLTKSIHNILPIPYPPNPYLPILLSKKRFYLPPNPSFFFPSISFHPNTHLRNLTSLDV